MDWYYSNEGSQVGPVSDEVLQGLVSAGTITPHTLVWRDGMENWQPFSSIQFAAGTLAPAAGPLVCVECGRPFPEDEMIRYGTSWVCAGCKPVFFQKLKEGVALAGSFVYAGFWVRFAAKFVDGLILWVVNMGVSLALGLASQGSSARFGTALFFVTFFIQTAIGAAYSGFFLGKFGATPGKMALGLKVVRPDGSPITYVRAVGRHFAEWISSMTLLIGYIMVAFDEEKRSLHDRICDTRVINA